MKLDSLGFEPLSRLMGEPEAADMITSHWDEIGEDHDDIPLRPNWDALLAAEERGELKVFAARVAGGKMVGYCVYYIHQHPHYQVKYAFDGPFYLDPEYRRGAAGLFMLKGAEPALKAMGVKRIIRHEKVAHPVGPLFERMGYRMYERRWTKVL